jgi:hypothetical protein
MKLWHWATLAGVLALFGTNVLHAAEPVKDPRCDGCIWSPCAAMDRMKMTVTIDFHDTPLRQVLEDLHTMVGLPIVFDQPIDLDQPVTVKLEDVSLKSALTVLLHHCHLSWQVADGCVMVKQDSVCEPVVKCSGSVGCATCPKVSEKCGAGKCCCPEGTTCAAGCTPDNCCCKSVKHNSKCCCEEGTSCATGCTPDNCCCKTAKKVGKCCCSGDTPCAAGCTPDNCCCKGGGACGGGCCAKDCPAKWREQAGACKPWAACVGGCVGAMMGHAVEHSGVGAMVGSCVAGRCWKNDGAASTEAQPNPWYLPMMLPPPPPCCVPCAHAVPVPPAGCAWTLSKGENGLHISGPGIEGNCDNVHFGGPDGCVTLEGHVQLKCHKDGHHAEVSADHVCVRLADMAIQVNGGNSMSMPVPVPPAVDNVWHFWQQGPMP